MNPIYKQYSVKDLIIHLRSGILPWEVCDHLEQLIVEERNMYYDAGYDDGKSGFDHCRLLWSDGL
jgi:hypothetical protein